VFNLTRVAQQQIALLGWRRSSALRPYPYVRRESS